MPTIYREGKLKGLNEAISNVGSFALQRQIQQQQRQQELQDAVKKALIEKALAGNVKGVDINSLKLQYAVKKALIEKALAGNVKGVDINSLMSGGAIPDLNSLQVTPDVSQLYKTMQVKRLGAQLENQRKMGVMGGMEEPSQGDITQLGPSLPQYGKLGIPTSEGGMVVPTAGQEAEYAPGYEPKPLPISNEDIAGAMRNKFAEGISKQELQRKAMGIPFTGKATQGQIVKLAKDLATAENPMAGEKDIIAKIPAAQKIFFGQAIDTTSEDVDIGEYSFDQEQTIQEAMTDNPEKTREEIIAALENKGYL